MVNSLSSERIEGSRDRRRRPILPRVGHRMQPQRTTLLEHAGELLGRVAPLARIEAHADECLPIRLCLFKRLVGLPLREVPEEAHDQRGRHAKVGLGLLDGSGEAPHHRLKGHSAGGVGLGIEEDLGPHDVVGRGPLEIGPGHVEEVLLVKQHGSRSVVDVKEALEIAEGVGPSHRSRIGVGERHPVAASDGKGQFRLERALDVEMEFGFGSRTHDGQQLAGRDP